MIVQKSHQVLDNLLNAVTDPMRLGAPPVTIKRSGVTLKAQKIRGSMFGGQVVQTEDGGFQFPSQTALFPEHPPHNITVKVTVLPFFLPFFCQHSVNGFSSFGLSNRIKSKQPLKSFSNHLHEKGEVNTSTDITALV